MKDDLGQRIKEQYENRTRFYLPRRTYTIIRLDGKAFHTYTRDCARPYDPDLREAMCVAARALCKDAQGVQFGYVQSDEMSFLLTDFATNQTDAWFDGNIQKITSVASSIITAHFNLCRHEQAKRLTSPIPEHHGEAYFDARVFTIPDRIEVMNYFIGRQKDAMRNSLTQLTQCYFSHKQLHGKSQSDMHDMLHGINVNWNDMHVDFKQGSIVWKILENDERRSDRWMYTGHIEPFMAGKGFLEEYVPQYPNL